MRNGQIIYVISEKEHLSLLPEASFRVLVTADLAEIKERFSKRMHETLPAPVSAMLERRHGCFDSERYDVHVKSGETDLDEACQRIMKAAIS